MGYIPTLRRGPTGVGHTFEQVFGLDENNLQLPDVGGRIEVNYPPLKEAEAWKSLS